MGIFDQTKIGQAVDGEFVLTESELNQLLKVLAEGVKLEQKRQRWKWTKWTIYLILCHFFFASAVGALDIFGLSLWGNAGVSLFFAFLLNFLPDSNVGEIEKIHTLMSEEFMKLGYRDWAKKLSNEHRAAPYVQIGTDLEVYNRNQWYHALGGVFKYPSRFSRIASILGSYLDSKWELPLNANKKDVNKKGLAQYALLFRLNQPYEGTEKSFLDTQYYWLSNSEFASGNHAPLMWRLDMKKYLAYLDNPKKY